MMRAFITDGHEELVSSAVVLLHDIERAEAATPDYLEVVQSIAEEFTPLDLSLNVSPARAPVHLTDQTPTDREGCFDAMTPPINVVGEREGAHHWQAPSGLIHEGGWGPATPRDPAFRALSEPSVPETP